MRQLGSSVPPTRRTARRSARSAGARPHGLAVVVLLERLREPLRQGANFAFARSFTGMTAHEPPTPAVDALVDSIVQSYGQIAQIVDHMARYSERNPNPDADPIPDVLCGLLSGVLAPLAKRHGTGDVAVAAQMLAAATERIADEILLVE